MRLQEERNEIKSNLNKFSFFLKENNFTFFASECERIIRLANTPHFTLVIAGEFSRGKSTFINRLLKKEILPTGITPTTSHITQIQYGKSNKIIVTFSNKEREYELRPESWSLINQISDIKSITIHFTEKKLNEYGLKIIDTPGANDLDNKKLNSVHSVISEADAVIVAVNANQALSLSERSFIEQNILTRKIPRIGVLVTRLDSIANLNERENIIQYIDDKLKSWASETLLLSAHDSNIIDNPFLFSAMGSEEIFDLIIGWAKHPTHLSRRNQQLLYQFLHLINLLTDEVSKQINLLKMDKSTRLETLKKEQVKLESRLLDWEDLRIDLLRKADDRSREINSILTNRESEVISNLMFELNQQNNPKEWWEKVLPFKLKKEILSLSNEIQEKFVPELIKDLKWAESNLEKQFDISLNYNEHTEFPRLDNNLVLNLEKNLQDLDRVQIISRLGTGAASLLAFTLFNPLGVFVGVVGGVISESYYKKESNEQKKFLVTQIERIYRQNTMEIIKEIKKRIRKVYKNVINVLKEQEENWLSSQKTNLNIDTINSFEEEKQIKILEERIIKLNNLKTSLIKT